jgi:2-polyprenyl-3-methyl-5-hydroxy-6-metoxy-1,4-benzoquinol methylase
VKEFWDERYGEEGHAYGTAPNVYLTQHADLFKPGQSALVIGDGQGRNGVWLAQQGLQVTSVDMSQVGLHKAAALAKERGVPLETVHADLTAWAWPQARFDFVVIIYVHFPPPHRARLHRAALQALKPGGQIILEAFSVDQVSYSSGGPRDPKMLYTLPMLQDDFKAGEILELAELVVHLEEGKYHVGDGAVIRARIRRPA